MPDHRPPFLIRYLSETAMPVKTDQRLTYLRSPMVVWTHIFKFTLIRHVGLRSGMLSLMGLERSYFVILTLTSQMMGSVTSCTAVIRRAQLRSKPIVT